MMATMSSIHASPRAVNSLAPQRSAAKTESVVAIGIHEALCIFLQADNKM